MLTRFHKFLIGLLVAQLALVILITRHHDDAGELKEHPLLPDFDAAKVTKVTIAGADGSVVLAKNGGNWVIASAFDYPVDAARVTELLAPIAKLAAAEPLATQAGRHKQLRVDDAEFDRKLTIDFASPSGDAARSGKPDLASGDKQLVLYIGSTVGHRVAVRIGGDDNVYGVTGISAVAAGPTPHDWTDLQYAKMPRAEIAKVTIVRDGTTLEVARAGGSWSAAINGAPVALATGETIDAAVIDRAVDELASIDSAAPGDPKRDASKPSAVITIERTAPAPAGSGSATPPPGPPPPPIVLEVIADGERYWVHQRGLATAAMVEKQRLDSAMTLDRDKLVKKPPPPPAGSGSGSGSAKHPIGP